MHIFKYVFILFSFVLDSKTTVGIYMYLVLVKYFLTHYLIPDVNVRVHTYSRPLWGPVQTMSLTVLYNFFPLIVFNLLLQSKQPFFYINIQKALFAIGCSTEALLF